jgi:hypothetical protein
LSLFPHPHIPPDYKLVAWYSSAVAVPFLLFSHLSLILGVCRLHSGHLSLSVTVLSTILEMSLTCLYVSAGSFIWLSLVHYSPF